MTELMEHRFVFQLDKVVNLWHNNLVSSSILGDPIFWKEHLVNANYILKLG